MYHGRRQLAQEVRAIMLDGHAQSETATAEAKELLRDVIRWTHNDPEAAAQVMADVDGVLEELEPLSWEMQQALKYQTGDDRRWR